MAQHSETLVSIPVDDVELEGMLEIPADAPGVVVFAHGSGSSRKSPRNNFVAEVIRDRGPAPCCSTSSPRRKIGSERTASISRC